MTPEARKLERALMDLQQEAKKLKRRRTIWNAPSTDQRLTELRYEYGDLAAQFKRALAQEALFD